MECSFIALCTQNRICFWPSKSPLFAAVDDAEHCLADVQEKLMNATKKSNLL